jgi:hypothetical protein
MGAQEWIGGAFTKKYKCDRLGYFERFSNIEFAITREKEIKGWRRSKKDKFVESLNPDWKDMAAEWYADELLLDGKPVKERSARSLTPTRHLKKTLAR